MVNPTALGGRGLFKSLRWLTGTQIEWICMVSGSWYSARTTLPLKSTALMSTTISSIPKLISLFNNGKLVSADELLEGPDAACYELDDPVLLTRCGLNLARAHESTMHSSIILHVQS